MDTTATSIMDAITNVQDEYIGLWCLIGVALVFFMQAGFAMVETGFTRAKNAGNIIMKNTLDFAIGAVVFWLFGFGILCGDDICGIIGMPYNPFAIASEDFPSLMFNMVFCATAATIVSGAMAERTKFSSYCLYSAIISLVVYPIEAHWIWGGGWLAQLGFVDFAGSTAVHMVGGIAATIGAIILGPRIGKYKKDKDGKTVSKAIPGHSLTLGALGVFILWFGWYGFNGAAATTVNAAAEIFTTTTVAAAVATITTMAITWVRYGKPDVSMTLNGALAGLVAITAGCANVSVTGSFFIGLIAAFVVVFGIEFIDKKLHIDDPVGAIGVHCLNGCIGTILVGVFDKQNGIISGFILNDSLTASEAFSFFGVQVLGVVAVAAFVAVTMTGVFLLINKTIGLRVSAEEEIMGLDLTEHGLVSSYADFFPAHDSVYDDLEPAAETSDAVGAEEGASLRVAAAAEPADAETEYDDGTVPVQEAIKVEKRSVALSEPRLTKISIITRPEKFMPLKVAMDTIGVTGMTMTQVQGCGMQMGSGNYYRGVKLDSILLPKIKLDVVVTKVSPESVIDAATKALYTGNYGDGKIFVYDVEDVIKIRTGEHGYDALQDDPTPVEVTD